MRLMPITTLLTLALYVHGVLGFTMDLPPPKPQNTWVFSTLGGCDTAADADYDQCIENTSFGDDKCENTVKKNLCFPKCFCEHSMAYQIESGLWTCPGEFSCGAPGKETTWRPEGHSVDDLKMSDYGCNAAADAEFELCNKKAMLTITGDDDCELFGKLSRCFPTCFCDQAQALVYPLMTGFFKCTKPPPCGGGAQGSPAPSLRASAFTACIAGAASLAGAVNLISV